MRLRRRFRITFRPDASAMRNGMRPDLLMAELVTLGATQVRISAEDFPDLVELDPTVCHLSWHVEIETESVRAAIEDGFIFATDATLDIVEVETGPTIATVEEVVERPAEPGAKPNSKSEATKVDSVRVQSHRLDEMMDQLGELVIAQARLNRIAQDMGDLGLSGVAEEIERLVTGMRDATLSIRMLPIELVFGKFRRVVRDLSAELGKQVRLDTRGGETEVDKNVIDSLTEPLVHIIRNSIDHGVESPEQRRAAGKPEKARVLLQARQSGGEVVISIADDGAGLDADAIRARGIERGLIAEHQEISRSSCSG